MEPVLVADDVQKSYGDTVALGGVSLSVGEGEVVALIGPNGAGKTTFTRCLTGTTVPDGGGVRLFGDPPGSADTDRLGLLPQAFNPPDRLTARELVAYYGGLFDESLDPEAVLADVGIDADDDTWYADLSGGQQRRVCVAATLVNDPDLLFLDEPTTGIDPAGRRSLWALLERLAEAGTTIFLTTHYMAEAERLADRVGLLAAGEIVEMGPPDELIATYGGASRLVVETDAGPDAFADSRFEVRADDGGLAFEGVAPTDIGDVVRDLDARGVSFEALSWSEPDLEDVYLTLTGERFEEDATEPTLTAATGGEP